MSEGDTTVTKLTINIEDENDETPTITGTLRIDINEDVSKGTVIPVQYTVEDTDQDDVLRYSISGKCLLSVYKGWTITMTSVK